MVTSTQRFGNFLCRRLPYRRLGLSWTTSFSIYSLKMTKESQHSLVYRARETMDGMVLFLRGLMHWSRVFSRVAMAESDEECELAHLVPKEDTKDATPPTTPTIGKIVATPSSPTSNKVSSSGGGSLSSRTVAKGLIAPSLTPVPGGSNSRFLYVNPKLTNLSRRPSLLSDSSSRTPKENNLTTRMNNMKKDSIAITVDPGLVHAPPNTPNPSSFREIAATCSASSLTSTLEAPSPDPWLRSSGASSQLTTKAVASEPDASSEDKGSCETLKNSSGLPETLNYLKHNSAGHTGLRSVGSTAFMKAFWASRSQQQRNVQHHSFLSDTTDVRQMEQALLQLLDDFHSGKLRAFAKDCSMEQMQGIREQQERLARLHFDLGARQELYAPLSDEGLRANQENMRHLMSSLQQLSMSIEKLQLFSKDNNQL